jgi:hypothetical protein
LCAIVCAIAGTTVLGLTFATAQTATINTLRGKIFDAKMAQQTFPAGLTHCSEFDGTNFYFQARDRVLNLEDYHRSLNSLALQGIYNTETKKPWDQEEADKRWAQAQQLAIDDKSNCQLVASLPEMQRQLDQLQQQAGPPPGTK